MVRQEQEEQERSLRKMVLKDTFNLNGRFSYDEMLNMSSQERRILSEICQEAVNNVNESDILRN